MLIHLTPTFINLFCDIDVILEKLLIIVNGNEYEIPIKDLSLKKPYLNKTYYVACRKFRNKSLIGLFVQVEPEQINKFTEFTVYEKWKTLTDDDVEREHIHYITFNLLDNNFDAISQNFLLWQQYRHSQIHKDWIPVNCTPCMEYHTNILRNGVRYNKDIKDIYFNGIIKQRNEQYYVPTMPHKELLKRGNFLYSNKMPDINDSFNLKGL
ncbi:hypothetical protein JP28_03855 [Gallibacterium anatis]|uniref:DUF6012 family protein n=1 Tax=Gallibacterium anatis TaxID=750 RepID=UPI0005321B64|nr:DUF6012 family protein [Gallibacterium anatis]KGQ44613.1 hypothetical protein JP28_03855 [Gallibacterium anatis]KGQ48087.1 hypothetical protein IO46_12230 [Gallibacterium anatis]